MQRILVVDNYDSFVHNLAALLRESNICEYNIVKVDKVDYSLLTNYNKILISPGPGTPLTTNNLLNIISHAYKTHPILGVCLGHQAIANYFGIELKKMNKPKHGHSSELKDVNYKSSLFKEIKIPIFVGRYHSWVIDYNSFKEQDVFIQTSADEENNIMSIEHTSLPIYGVQFHPESIICNCGKQIINNWLRI